MASPDPNRAAALQELGYKAYRLGNHARARQLFARALSLLRASLGDDHPATTTALSDLGAADAAMGDHIAALASHEAALRGRRAALGDIHEDVAASLHNLAATKRALGQTADAETHQTEALAIWRACLGETHPVVAKAHASLAALARDNGDAPAATSHALAALAILRQLQPPDHHRIAAAHDEAAMALTLAGGHETAENHWSAAIALLQNRAGTAPLLHKIGVSRRRRGDLAGAARAFTQALAADPTLVAARHNLATTLTRLGETVEAKTHRDLALRAQNIFVQPGPPGAPAVLIPSLAGDGNIPLDHLLPEHATTRIWWFIGHAGDPAKDALPFYDIVFNAIGDPDLSAAADAKLAAFLSVCEKPVLNDPARVAATRRDRVPTLLAGIDGLTTPRICRIETPLSPAHIAAAAENAGITLPALLRTAGAHGGDGVLRVDDWAALNATTPHAHPAWYLSQFHDCRSPDGYARKYRAIFVDRVFYPYHLAISPHWMVHYYTADMPAHDWKLAEEARFLADPAAILGPRRMAALAQAGKRLDLDYCGIDFATFADGTVLVFEANPTMLVHPETENTKLAFKNVAVGHIWRAIQGLLF
jgi:tetratricopeptide (TPR) repeat protein